MRSEPLSLRTNRRRFNEDRIAGGGIAYSKNVWGGDGKLSKDSVDGEAEEESDRKECVMHLEYTTK